MTTTGRIWYLGSNKVWTSSLDRVAFGRLRTTPFDRLIPSGAGTTLAPIEDAFKFRPCRGGRRPSCPSRIRVDRAATLGAAGWGSLPRRRRGRRALFPARGGPGLGSVGCSPYKPMLLIREANGYKAEGFSRQRVLYDP